ncbi:hypothetical protein KY285_013161 [Solanum tuberosum]|nr:hypothetical protein KY285_013161 [Solanum tuberosum]
MAEALAIAVGKYTYVHEVGKGPPEAIDAHHIVVRRSREKGFNLCLFTLLLFAYPTFLLFRQGKLDTLHIWSLVIMALLMRFNHIHCYKGRYETPSAGSNAIALCIDAHCVRRSKSETKTH